MKSSFQNFCVKFGVKFYEFEAEFQRKQRSEGRVGGMGEGNK